VEGKPPNAWRRRAIRPQHAQLLNRSPSVVPQDSCEANDSRSALALDSCAHLRGTYSEP
jgi:hypothetical protein